MYHLIAKYVEVKVLSSLDLVTVSSGFFTVGIDDWEDYDLNPPQKVWIPEFKILRTPITVGHWYQFLRQSRYHWPYDKAATKSSPTDNHPATFVSWYDADEFAAWLRRVYNLPFNLPTELQWEKACRGTDGRLYPWGNEFHVYSEKDHDKYRNQRAVVGEYLPNPGPYGCLDMGYNVYEWCREWFTYDMVLNASYNDFPEDGVPLKSLRGGSAVDYGAKPCARRSYAKADVRGAHTGFRIVLDEV